jgi:hypothetical protein
MSPCGPLASLRCRRRREEFAPIYAGRKTFYRHTMPSCKNEGLARPAVFAV